MRICFTILLIIRTHLIFGQGNFIDIKFSPTFNNTALEIDKKYKFQGKDIEIHVLKFYVSNIEFYQNHQKVGSFAKEHHLIDLEKPESLILNQPNNIRFNKITFNLGIDSTTNVSGAFGEDLDPTNGMYWTWQSGYINFKLEGKSKLCPSRNNQFSFHIGGYQYPFNSLQKISLPVPNSTEINIEIDVETLLKNINLKQTFEVMSPNQKAMEIAKNIVSTFKTTK